MEEIPMESAPYAKPETIEQKKIENTQKNISLTHDNKIFSIEFKNEIDFLSVTASYQESLFPVKFTGKFSLNDIKKVGLFRVYDSIDECLFEIFEGLNSNPSITEKDNLNIIIKVPLHTKKFPEITFTLKKVEKSESQKYDELVNVLLKMKNEKDEKDKEIKELKNKVENLEKLLNLKKEQKTNIEDSEEKFDGIKIEIFTIGNDEYFDFFPKKNQCQENICGFILSIILECNEKDIKYVTDSFNKYKDDIKNLIGLGDSDKEFNIITNKNNIIINLFVKNENNKDNEKKRKKDIIFDMLITKDSYGALGIFASIGMKIILKSKISLLDVSEITNEENIEIINNTMINLKGDIMIYKILLGIAIIYLYKEHYENYTDKNKVDKNDKNKDDDKNKDNDGNKNDDIKKDNEKIFFDFLNDIYLSISNGNLNYSIKDKELLDNLKKINKLIINFVKPISVQCVNLFKDLKYRVFQKINFNKIKIGICGSPKYNVGILGIKFESPKNNEFIDKVLNGKIK